jgi:hypothetical protein
MNSINDIEHLMENINSQISDSDSITEKKVVNI